jgi:hypothetical protein
MLAKELRICNSQESTKVKTVMTVKIPIEIPNKERKVRKRLDQREKKAILAPSRKGNNPMPVFETGPCKTIRINASSLHYLWPFFPKNTPALEIIRI